MPSTIGTPALPSASWTVNDTLLRIPAAVETFNAFGIDACCGGAASLAAAARDAGVPLAALLLALEHVARRDAGAVA